MTAITVAPAAAPARDLPDVPRLPAWLVDLALTVRVITFLSALILFGLVWFVQAVNVPTYCEGIAQVSIERTCWVPGSTYGERLP